MPTYSAVQLSEWREAVADAWRDQLDDPPQGWSISPADFAPIIAALPTLRLKSGVRWHAYQFRERDSAHARLFALPDGAALPPPDFGSQERSPQPPGALEQFMDAIDGDDSPESYLHASLLRREMESFGTAGHGTTLWEESRIVDTNPLDTLADSAAPDGTLSGTQEDWKWENTPPDDWRPRVDVSRDEVVVQFYSVTAMGQQRVRRHTDFYPRKSYRAVSDDEIIAHGPRGYVF